MAEVIKGAFFGALAGFVLTANLVSSQYQEGRDECEASLPRDVNCVMVWEVEDGTE